MRRFGIFVRDPSEHMLAVAYARAIAAAKVLAVQGLFIQSPEGEMIAHPAVAIERDARSDFIRLLELT